MFGFGPDAELLRRAGRSSSASGIDQERLEPGCCGLAGNFGFERGPCDVSGAAGERVLLPAVREGAEETLVLADGFSCRTQIEQGTGLSGLHLAEVPGAVTA